MGSEYCVLASYKFLDYEDYSDPDGWVNIVRKK